MGSGTVAALQAALGFTFLAAACAKLAAPRAVAPFLEAVSLPEKWARPVSTIIPWLEITLGGALVAGILPLVTAMAAAAMALIFGAVLGVALVRGVREPCRCFGALDANELTWVSLTRPIFLLLAASLLSYQDRAQGPVWFRALWTQPTVPLVLSVWIASVVLLATSLLERVAVFWRWSGQASPLPIQSLDNRLSEDTESRLIAGI